MIEGRAEGRHGNWPLITANQKSKLRPPRPGSQATRGYGQDGCCLYLCFKYVGAECEQNSSMCTKGWIGRRCCQQALHFSSMSTHCRRNLHMMIGKTLHLLMP